MLFGVAAFSLVGAACGDDGDDTIDTVQDEIEDIGGAVADAIDEFGEDAVEVVARNVASTQGEQGFADAGYPIDGELSCSADATDDLTAVQIDCAGATEDGSVAELTGTTDELPGVSITELEGSFEGFIDTEAVFRTDSLG